MQKLIFEQDIFIRFKVEKSIINSAWKVYTKGSGREKESRRHTRVYLCMNIINSINHLEYVQSILLCIVWLIATGYQCECACVCALK